MRTTADENGWDGIDVGNFNGDVYVSDNTSAVRNNEIGIAVCTGPRLLRDAATTHHCRRLKLPQTRICP